MKHQRKVLKEKHFQPKKKACMAILALTARHCITTEATKDIIDYWKYSVQLMKHCNLSVMWKCRKCAEIVNLPLWLMFMIMTQLHWSVVISSFSKDNLFIRRFPKTIYYSVSVLRYSWWLKWLSPIAVIFSQFKDDGNRSFSCKI